MKGGEKLSNFGTEKLSPDARRELITDIIRQYADFIFRTAYQSLKNRSDAEDVLQEVSVALVKSNAPLTDSLHLKSWLVTVTLNKCRDLRRYQARRSYIPLEECENIEVSDTREVMEELWQLPENYRTVIYLHYYAGFKIVEIAEILGKNPNTVGTRLRRGRKALEKILKEEGSDYE